MFSSDSVSGVVARIGLVGSIWTSAVLDMPTKVSGVTSMGLRLMRESLSESRSGLESDALDLVAMESAAEVDF